MAKAKKPVSRLVLLFILVVFIAGVILAYLSINNIANLRILTERRMQIEQQRIASHLSADFQDKINNKAEEFSSLLPDSGQAIPAGFNPDVQEEPRMMPFVLSPEKVFLYPWFLGPGQGEHRVQNGSSIFDFSSGEMKEFQNGDFLEAFSHYSLALRKSENSNDSAKIYNALGRVSLKLKQPGQSWEYYRKILIGFRSELNSNGFPFAYFSISQLIKLFPEEKRNETGKLAKQFIADMANGNIPLNQSTSELISDISAWLNNLPPVFTIGTDSVKAMVRLVNSRLEFISDYGNLIRELLAETDKPEFPPVQGKYRVLTYNSEDKNGVLLLDDHRRFPAGFLLELNDIWDQVKDNNQGGTEFDYNISLLPVSSIRFASEGDNSIRTELSPYFPLHRIVIQPANSEAVRRFVTKRSWTYGIALFLLIGGMSLGILLILRDIRREKKMAEMQSEFVANVTHELKTPLTSINMFAESIYLDRAKSEEVRKKYSNIIMKESEVLKRKIDNILEYSVRKNNSNAFRFSHVDLAELVREIMCEMKYWLDINKFNVTTEIEEGIHAHVDPDALKQVLANLIGNAIKYSPVDKNLTVRLHQSEGKITIEVEDTGIGIPLDQADLIFKKFYRIRGRENDSSTGTGLGLAVARDIVTAHNGQIFVTSEINKGSKFTIVLNS